MELESALRWAAARNVAALITIRNDGRPQSSDISYGIADGVFKISVTADRAKTINMRRDPRVVLHISDPGAWSYVSFDGIAELTPAAADPGDATCDALVAYYELVAGKAHPDWDDYRAAMVRDRRVLLTVKPSSAVGVVRD